MMLILTSEDQVVIELLARECSRDGEEAETIKVLVDGFSTYSEEAILELKKRKKTYVSREEFFRDRFGLLIENVGFAGQAFEQAFSSTAGRDLLCQLVRGVGVPVSDIEDIVQEISRKFWQAKWVERYNPLISSWRNFLLVPIRRYVNTYKSRRGKKVTTGAVPLDRDDERGNYRNTAASRLYELNEDDFPENNLIRQEVMEDWETYLRSQKPIRPFVRRDFDKMCTLIPPGTSEIPTDEEVHLLFLRGGPYHSRVTTRELYEGGITAMVPNEQLVDYITTDPVDHAQYVDEVTGDFITQKDFPNPNYDPSVVIKEQRTWMDLYSLLMRDLQVEEIAHELKMAPPSIPARIQRLESLFRDFWLASNKIPRKSKNLAMKTYQCPRCRRLDIIEREECSACGTDMRVEVAEVRFSAYPWPKVYVTRETYERLGNRRQALVVQRGSLSVRF
jgi:DNA-directed RNA polymerase specialized sigma24 family protein